MKNLLDTYKSCNYKVSTDTRNITEGSLFFALKGENFNGNEFALKAIESGAKYAVVDEQKFEDNERIIVVNDALKALQTLAHDYRKQFDIPVLAITGSNGKTTAKELIHCVISRKFKCHSTPGNFNNHIGLPLTLLSMPQDTEFCILEMGDNHMGEIALLSEIGAPTHALVTNVGKDHIEGFGSFENNKLAKKELFDYIDKENGIAFIPQFEPEIEELASEVGNQISFGGANTGYYLSLNQAKPFIEYKDPSDKNHLTKLIGEYNIFNIQMAFAIGSYFKVDEKDIHEAICSYQPNNLRSVFLEKGDNSIFLDAYNSNPSSLEAALDSFNKQQLKEQRVIILGDMLELGSESKKEHQSIVDQLMSYRLEVYLVGNEFKKTNFSPSVYWFKDRFDLIDHIVSNPIRNSQILLKGSRGIRLEEVVEVL